MARHDGTTGPGAIRSAPRSRKAVERLLAVGAVVVVFAIGFAGGFTASGGGRPHRLERGEVVASVIDWSSPASLPPPRHEEFRSEFVSEEEGYRFHPRSSRGTPVMAYRFDTGHCGLSFLADFDGSFWRPIDVDGGQAPDFFFNQDVGAIALVDHGRAIYRSSTGVQVPLERLRGPVVTQPCA